MEEAKRHVVQDYLVVGVVEEFDDFVKVLEILIPSFFRGAYAKWKSPGIEIKGELKPEISLLHMKVLTF